MRRRAMLHALGVATLFAGCSTSPPVSRTPDDCTIPESSPLPSTEVPSELTRDSAESFALSVEKSYAIQRANTDGWNVDGIDWTKSSVEEDDGGFVVKATVSLDAHKSTQAGTGTETLYGSLLYSGWYQVSETRAERAPGDDGKTPPERGWTTIACS